MFMTMLFYYIILLKLGVIKSVGGHWALSNSKRGVTLDLWDVVMIKYPLQLVNLELGNEQLF